MGTVHYLPGAAPPPPAIPGGPVAAAMHAERKLLEASTAYGLLAEHEPLADELKRELDELLARSERLSTRLAFRHRTGPSGGGA